MDIYRKEIDSIYRRQHLENEVLDKAKIGEYVASLSRMAEISNACYVVTDASADSCSVCAGAFARLLGFTDETTFCCTIESSDEDFIYNRLHPEDLVEKRMLEHEVLNYADSREAERKLEYKASCRIRVLNRDNEYVYVDNSTQVLHLSPSGKMWLILCCYNLSADQTPAGDISPKIVNSSTGEIRSFAFGARRKQILSGREKEILQLIKDGKPSKQIADILGISINTVNRHRQNILEKLSVGNSVEAVTAATAMKLL